MKFKTCREEEEFGKLVAFNPRLRAIVAKLDEFSLMELGKEITITHLFRTDAEHAELYKETPASDRPKTSPHCRWQALDIRSHGFSIAEIERLVGFCNCFIVFGGRKKCAMYHAITGGAFHVHIQADPK